MVQPLQKTAWQVLRKLNINLPFDSAIPLLGIYTKEMKVKIQTSISTPMFIPTLFTIAKSRNNPDIHPWMNGHTKHGIYYIEWDIIQH